MNNAKPKVLVVDDEKFYIDLLVELLSDDYRVVVAKAGEQALRLADTDPRPDLILLDVLMPAMDGYEVCRRLKRDSATRDIPVIFLTVKSEVADELRGFELGAADYIAKPISPPIVRARVGHHLNLARTRQDLAEQNQMLERIVAERTREVVHTQDVAIYCMATLAETRDNETGNHILRTKSYVGLLADGLQDHPRYRDWLGDDQVRARIRKSAPLHDIGKVGIPDRILTKPGPLDDAEWAVMRRHAEYGHTAIKKAEATLGNSDFLNVAADIALTHHERWDGSGYPNGLAGEQIPIPGRLMALADVYDALVNKRVYKPAFSHQNALKLIAEGRETHFDPAMVDVFFELADQFHAIALRYREA